MGEWVNEVLGGEVLVMQTTSDSPILPAVANNITWTTLEDSVIYRIFRKDKNISKHFA